MNDLPGAKIGAAIGPCQQTQHLPLLVPVVDIDGIDDRASLIEMSYFTDLKRIQIVRVGDEEENLRPQGEPARRLVRDPCFPAHTRPAAAS